MSRIKTCVSLYSLQDEYLNKRMSLKEILHFLKENGVEGIEILPDQMIHGAPNPTEETFAAWDAMIKEAGLTPVIADVFLNTNLYNNRSLTPKECVELLKQEVVMTSRLGIKLIRLVSMVPAFVLEPLLPTLEKYQVTVALEIHAGMAFDIPQTQEFIAEMKRLDSPYIGLVIDTGIFCRKLPRVVARYNISIGGTSEIYDFVNARFAEGTDMKQYNAAHGGWTEEFKALIKNDVDMFFAMTADGYENLPYSILDEYMPYIRHFHFKLFEMTEEGVEYSMDYKGLLEYLHEKGYDGYVSTEYEGNRFVPAGEPMKEKEQVLAHQAYIRKCLKEIQG